MESTQPIAYTAPVNRGVFGTRIPSSVAFLTGVLLFFLPFIDIKCNNYSIQKISGVQVATGFHIKPAGGNNSLLGNMESTTGVSTAAKGERKDPNVYALAALGLGLLAFALSLINGKAGSWGGILLGTLTVAAMIGLVLDIKRSIKAESLGTEDGVTVSVDFTPWFYISLLAFVAAILFSFMRMRPVKNE